ncbi:hypothetical protein BDZ91DRAFT_722399 [Kalaharituber pfeilii]|nr:hypothetical protein BDZ91DRAFT_722399 [Kalaharituber pfeilii]
MFYYYFSPHFYCFMLPLYIFLFLISLFFIYPSKFYFLLIVMGVGFFSLHLCLPVAKKEGRGGLGFTLGKRLWNGQKKGNKIVGRISDLPMGKE